MLHLLPPPIALEHRIATVEAVVAELARKTGRPLAIKSEMRDEALFVALGPHPADESMRLVARATSAEWSSEAGRVYLGRSATLRRRQATVEEAALAADQKARIALLLDPNDATTWGATGGRAQAIDKEQASFDSTREAWPAHQARLRTLTPIGRLLSRTLRRLPTSELAAVPPSSVVRFALDPTPRQRPLPAGIGVEQYVAERNLLVADVARLPPDRRAQNAFLAYGESETLPEHPYIQALARRYGDGPVSLTVSVYESRGARLDWAVVGLGGTPAAPGAALPGYAAWKARPLAVDAATASFLAGYRENKVDPHLAARLLDPVANEPLADILGGPLDALFGAVGGEAIVALPDDLLARADEALGDPKPTLGGFAEALAEGIAFANEGSALVGSARRPAEAALTKTDRAKLRDLLRLAVTRPLRLNETARYALDQNPESVATEFEMRVTAGAGLRDSVDMFGSLFDAGTGQRDFLRTWGSLSPAQQDALVHGGMVPVGETSPGTQACLDTLLFRRSIALSPTKPGRSVGIDPTMLADGPRPGMTLSGNGLRSTLVVATNLGSPTGRGFAEAAGLGDALWAQEHGEAPQPQFGAPDVAKGRFVPGVKTQFNLRLRLTPDYEYWGVLADTDLDPTATAVPYAELPPAHLKALRDEYESAKKAAGPG